MVIHKQVIEPAINEQKVELPFGAKILKADFQGQDFCIWYIFNEVENRVQEKKLFIVGTGMINPNINHSKYIDTYQMANGKIVFHLFEEY